MKQIVKNNIYMLKKLIQICPQHFIFTIIADVLTAGMSLWNIVLLKYIVDQISCSYYISKVILFICVYSSVNIVLVIFSAYLNRLFIPRNTLQIQQKFKMELYNKVMNIPFGCFDIADFYNLYSMAINEADKRVFEVLQTVSLLTSSIVSIAGCIAIISGINKVILFIASVLVVFSTLVSSLMTKTQYQYSMGAIPYTRRFGYIGRVYYLKEYLQELHSNLGVNTILQEDIEETTSKAVRLTESFGKKLGQLQAIVGGIPVVLQMIILILACIQVYAYGMTVGNLVALVSSSITLFSQTNSLISVGIRMYSSSLYIERYISFMNYPEIEKRNNTRAIPDNVHIRLNKISFSYGKGGPLLDNLTLEIEPNSKISIMGENGAGKSTILRILANIYHPEKGEILINQIALDEYDPEEFRECCCYIPQDYQLFAFSIAENVLMRTVKNENDEIVVQEALKKVRMLDKVLSLPEGINTPITKEFSENGAVFSGGELQRIALARAFTNKFKIILADEPTSKVDDSTSLMILEELFSIDNCIVIVSTHDNRVKCVADTTYVLTKKGLKKQEVRVTRAEMENVNE